MSKQKYTNYGNKFNKNDTHIAAAEAEKTMIPVSEVIDRVINEELGNVEPEEPSKPALTTCIVTANKLNIRKLPSPGAEVATVVNRDTELMIDPEYEAVEWIKVCTAAGIEGYCMKRFVEIK